MIRKYIYYCDKRVFALYYKTTKTIYYNINFAADTKLILFK